MSQDGTTETNLDLVYEMEQMGVGVDEIVEFARAVLSKDELRSLAYCLEQEIRSTVVEHA